MSEFIENSIIISISIRIWTKLKIAYKYSLFKRVINKIGEVFKYLSKGSLFINFFTSNRELINKSIFYKIYCKFIDLMYSTIEKMRKVVNKGKEGSIIYRTFSKLFKNRKQIHISFHIFFLFFGFTILLINLGKKFVFTKEVLISLLVIFISLIGLSIRNIYEKVLQGSIILQGLKSTFTIDEEGD